MNWKHYLQLLLDPQYREKTAFRSDSTLSRIWLRVRESGYYIVCCCFFSLMVIGFAIRAPDIQLIGLTGMGCTIALLLLRT